MAAAPASEVRSARLRADGPRARCGAALGCMLGWILCAVVTAARVQLSDPIWSGSASAIHLAMATGHLLGAGAAIAALVHLSGLPHLRSRVWRRAAVALAAAPVLRLVLADDLSGVAQALGDVPPELTLAGAAIAGGVGIALAVELGARFRGRRGRLLALVAAAVAVWIEPSILRGLYPGFHASLVLGAACFAGAALTGARLPRLLRTGARPTVAALAVLGLATYAIPVSSVVHFLVVRDGDVVAQLAGAYLPRDDGGLDPACAGSDIASEWLIPRRGLPSTPPTPGERSVESPIVVLLTIDCLRYDLVGGARTHASLPSLARLRREGAHFERAYSPGSSTVYTLTSVFSGKYYSQLEWSPQPSIWPSADRTPRFPELLREDGVWTVHAASFDWLDDERGVTRGFDVLDYDALPGPRWKPARSLAAALVRRLGEVGDRRAFLYAHFNDAHLPYDLGGRRGTPFERYVRELAIVDAQVGTILDAIDRLGLRSRTYVFVTSDHGEAFREHGRIAHGHTLYQELTHVPLLVRGPGVVPTTITTPVSLIDLGPTILDVFGIATPASFMGESLYPGLLGRPIELTRPIVAQDGHMRSLVTPEGLVVMRDVQRGTLEAYDLTTDPGERTNLIARERADVTRALRVLDCFFAAHQFRRFGYEEPFR